MTLVRTNVGDRISSGTITVLKDEMNSGNKCMVGDIVKYINICVQVAPRWVTGGAPVADDNGWLEFGIVKIKEGHVAPSTTNLGTKTLGDILTTDYRGDCIHTGCLPIGAQQGTSIDLKIKLPKVWCKLQWGSKLLLYFHYRSSGATDVRSDSMRVITSFLFKSYN